jgi:hypothetical protein
MAAMTGTARALHWSMIPQRLPFLATLCCCCLGSAGQLAAVVAPAGVPQPPTPAPTPVVWFALQDDLFGDAVIETDDFRTGGMHVGAEYHRWLLAVDASALTNRGTKAQNQPPDRSDELTYTLGYALTQRESRTRAVGWLLAAGAGGRTYGDLGGEGIQNGLHGASGFPTLRLPYDRQRGTVGIGYAYGRLLWLPLRALPAPLPSAVGLQVDGSGTGTSIGGRTGTVSADLVAMGGQAVAWAGVAYQRTQGREPTRVARIVADHENGLWITAGLARAPGVYVSAAIDPRTGAVDGNIGATVGPAAPVRRRKEIDESLELYAQGGAIGVQVRWSLGGSDREHVGLRHLMLFDYHFGTVPGYAWRGNRVEEDQAVIGYEPALAGPVPALPWLISEEYLYGAGGVRVERVQVVTPPARFAQDTATAPVATGGVGLRVGLNLGGKPTRLLNQIRLGVEWSAWAPLRRQVIGDGGDHAYYLNPGSAVVLSLGFATYW